MHRKHEGNATFSQIEDATDYNMDHILCPRNKEKMHIVCPTAKEKTMTQYFIT